MSSSTDPTRERAESRIGMQVVRKYTLETLLGIGGMAAVYAARHRNGDRVAIKVLHAELAVHLDIRTRFQREGYVANSVGHDGAVRVIDDGMTEDGAVFLVMELLEGETVEDRWERAGARLPESEVMTIADELLATLEVAHAKGVVHRDLKPENLFITCAGKLKILDFGIARLTESGASATQSGKLLGTPAFMPPEQALGQTKDVDAQSDLFALGATMFTLLTGRYIHEAATGPAMLIAAATRAPPAIATVLPDVTPELAAVVDQALQIDKSRRVADAKTMRAALHAVPSYAGQRADLTVPVRIRISDGSQVAREAVQSRGATVEDPARTTGQGVARAGQRTSERPAARRRGPLVGIAAAAIVLAVVTFMTFSRKGATGRALPETGPATTSPPSAATGEPASASASASTMTASSTAASSTVATPSASLASGSSSVAGAASAPRAAVARRAAAGSATAAGIRASAAPPSTPPSAAAPQPPAAPAGDPGAYR